MKGEGELPITVISTSHHLAILWRTTNYYSCVHKQDLHRCMVERYQKKCGGAFWNLEDDKYVFTKLICHVVCAGMYVCIYINRASSLCTCSSHCHYVAGKHDLLGNFLTQLRWLISSVIFGNPNLLLAQYGEHKSKVSIEVSYKGFQKHMAMF